MGFGKGVDRCILSASTHVWPVFSTWIYAHSLVWPGQGVLVGSHDLKRGKKKGARIWRLFLQVSWYLHWLSTVYPLTRNTNSSITLSHCSAELPSPVIQSFKHIRKSCFSLPLSTTFLLSRAVFPPRPTDLVLTLILALGNCHCTYVFMAQLECTGFSINPHRIFAKSQRRELVVWGTAAWGIWSSPHTHAVHIVGALRSLNLKLKVAQCYWHQQFLQFKSF